MNIYGGSRDHEVYCVSWKAEAISTHGTARSVRYVSEGVMALATADASKSTSVQSLLFEIPTRVPGQNIR